MIDLEYFGFLFVVLVGSFVISAAAFFVLDSGNSRGSVKRYATLVVLTALIISSLVALLTTDPSFGGRAVPFDRLPVGSYQILWSNKDDIPPSHPDDVMGYKNLALLALIGGKPTAVILVSNEIPIPDCVKIGDTGSMATATALDGTCPEGTIK